MLKFLLIRAGVFLSKTLEQNLWNGYRILNLAIQ